MARSKVYLGKQGKIHGPFSEAELESLQRTGQIRNYTFIWDTRSRNWTPIEAPPPSPEADAETGEGGIRASGWNDLDAICHNFVSIVSGKLEGVTETGCELVSTGGEESPRLPDRAAVMLNLMDPSTGKSTNVRSKLAEIYRRDGTWIYRINWESRPRL